MPIKGQKTTSSYVDWNTITTLILKLERDGNWKFSILISIGIFYWSSDQRHFIPEMEWPSKQRISWDHREKNQKVQKHQTEPTTSGHCCQNFQSTKDCQPRLLDLPEPMGNGYHQNSVREFYVEENLHQVQDIKRWNLNLSSFSQKELWTENMGGQPEFWKIIGNPVRDT